VRITTPNSPNARIQDWQVIITNPLASLARIFFSLTYPYIYGQFFVDLASKNTELLASLANVLKKLFTPLQRAFVCGPHPVEYSAWERQVEI
jgi:hypothetical protein